MPSPETLEFESLLAPISEDSPTGAPLRGSDPESEALFYEIKDARTEARQAERQRSLQEMTEGVASGQAAVKPADWRKVVDLANVILKTRSKDMWVSAWMLEGLCRTEGYAGLRDGFRLVRELCERYWDHLHPRSETDPQDVSTLITHLAGVLDGILNPPIYEIPITGSYPRNEADHVRRLSVTQLRLAMQLEQSDPKQRRQQMERGAITMEDFARAVADTPVESFRNRLDDLDASLAELQAITKELDQRCGSMNAPSTAKTREALEDCRSRLVSIAKDKLATPQEAAAESPETAPGDGHVSPTGPAPRTGFASREQAFQTLIEVADYFRKHEPHSIVSYSLEQIVRWGRMSLPELLTELITDKKARQELFRHTGIAASAEESSE